MILDDTGHTVEELFETFDPIPIGAGMNSEMQHYWRTVADGYQPLWPKCTELH